jgi:hypothetical protein
MPAPEAGMSDFSLLDSTYCFLTSPSGHGSIQLYKLERSRTSNASSTHHLATLHLPCRNPRTTIDKICTSAGPIEAHPLPHSSPFMVNDDDRLHVFTIAYRHTHVRASNIERVECMPTNLFVHQRVFTKYCIQQQRQHADGDAAPLDIAWEEWGPPNTRIVFPSCTDPKWPR